jgi:hypothetical protein
MTHDALEALWEKGAGLVLAYCVAWAGVAFAGALAMPAFAGPGSSSLRSPEPLRVSSAHAVTIPIAGELSDAG